MENNNKYKKIIIILSVILVVLLLAFGGLYLYRKFVVLKGIERTNVPIQHGSVDNNKKEEKVVLDEEDVKKWLDNNQLIERYFVLNKNDFNYETADVKDYSNVISSELVKGSEYSNFVIDSKELSRVETGYDYQYTYSLDFVKKILKDYFNVGIEKIDVNLMNEINKEIGNFAINEDNFVVKYRLATENSMSKEITKISLNNNEIIVQYNVIIQGDAPEYDVLDEVREIVLKKNDNGYNILKAYKVEN